MSEKVRIQTITPDKATRWLQGDGRNRKLDVRRVRFYAEEMKGGRWVLNNDAITFNGDGSLLNGQHRLSACVLADTAFQAVVLDGAPTESFSKMDTGKKRNAGTILYLAEIPDSSKVAPIIRAILGLELIEGQSKPKSLTRAFHVDDILNFARKHSDALSEAVHAVRPSAIARPKGVWGALYFLICLRGGEAGKAWMHQVLTGENTEPGMPAHAVRERAIRQSADRIVDNIVTADFVIHGWHAFLQGRKLAKSSAGSGDTFPEIQSNSIGARRYNTSPKRKA